jgi:hypothetical protein
MWTTSRKKIYFLKATLELYPILAFPIILYFYVNVLEPFDRFSLNSSQKIFFFLISIFNNFEPLKRSEKITILY